MELLNNIFLYNTKPLNSHVQKITQGWQEVSTAASLAKQKHRRKCVGSETTGMCPWTDIEILFEGIV